MWKSRCTEKRGKSVTTNPNKATGITFNGSGTRNRDKLECSQVKRHSPLKKCYKPSDFTENDKIEPVHLLKSEIIEWKRQELMTNKMEERIEKLRINEPESDNCEDSTGEAHPPTEASSIASLIELSMEQEKGITMDDVVPADINIQLGTKEQMSPDSSTSPSLDFNTMNSLQDAEKLVQEAERTIVEARWNVCLNETSLENTQLMDLDEEIMEIRCIVAAKFDEANGRRIKKNKKIIPEELPQKNKDSRNQGQCIDAKTRESRRLKKSLVRKTCEMTKKEENSLRNIRVQNGPRIDIRNKMSFSKIEAVEILPSATVSERNTVKLFQWRHEACKRGWINDRESLIDAAVQTSLRDSSPIESPKFGEPVQDALSRSHSSDLDQNKIHQLNLSRGEEMGNSGSNCGINDNEALTYRNLNNPKTFMDFLCQMEVKDEDNKKEEIMSSRDYDSQLDSLPSEGISLETPDVGNLNAILNKIDKKLGVISKVTERINVNTKNNENHVKVLLKPRSRVSSSSSVGSSEIFHPPERFSTPLNNLKIDAPFNVKLQINEQRAKVIIPSSEAILIDAKSVIEATRVAITRNKFSSSSFNDENESKEIINGLSSESSDSEKKKSIQDKMGEETGSSFPSYSTGKLSNELKFKSIQEQKDILTQSINIEMRLKPQEFQSSDKIDNSVAFNKDNLRNSENSLIFRSTKNKDNSEHLSSGRDRTSNDISGLSSRILETLSNEKIQASRISTESKEKLAIESSSSREEISEKKDNTLSNHSSKKTISITSSSSSTDSKRSSGKKSASYYSEGELFLPSSCGHSLGEIVPSNPSVPDNFNKFFVNLSNQASLQIANMITDGSSGEVLITDIESNSSFG